jgi:O-Antigen ligase
MPQSSRLGKQVARRVSAVAQEQQLRSSGIVKAVRPIVLALPISIPAIFYGGNLEVVECITAIVFCLMATGLFVTGAADRFIQDRKLWLVFTATSLLAIWPLLQLVPGSATGSSFKSWANLAAIGIEPAAYTATLSINDTWRTVPVGMATWAAFWIGILAFGKRSNQVVLWIVLLAFIAFNCFYGLGIFISGRNEVLGVKRDEWIETVGGIVSGTFINRNHFAFYCCLGITLALTLMTRTKTAKPKSVRQKLRATFDSWPLLILVPLFGILFVGIFLSHSRGAMLSALILIVVALASRIRSSKRMLGLGLALLISVPVVYQATHVTDYERARLGSMGESAGTRWQIQRETARAVFDTNGLGVGAGAFEPVFPFHRRLTPSSPEIWNYAHGSYIEWPFTYGVPWALLLLLTTLGITTFIITQREKTGPSNALVAVLTFIACTLHIAYDFGLQTIGLTVIVAALAGSSFGRALGSSERRSRRSSETPSVTNAAT